MKINNRKIGIDNNPLVIAEIGINHGGDLEVAKEMVVSAKRAGVEIVKHQTHIIEDEMSIEAQKINYAIPKKLRCDHYWWRSCRNRSRFSRCQNGWSGIAINTQYRNLGANVLQSGYRRNW